MRSSRRSKPLASMVGSASKTVSTASRSCKKACRSCVAKSRSTGRLVVVSLSAKTKRISDFHNGQHSNTESVIAGQSAPPELGRASRVRSVLDYRGQGNCAGGRQVDELAL